MGADKSGFLSKLSVTKGLGIKTSFPSGMPSLIMMYFLINSLMQMKSVNVVSVDRLQTVLAAEALGVKYTTLYEKVKRHNIQFEKRPI